MGLEDSENKPRHSSPLFKMTLAYPKQPETTMMTCKAGNIRNRNDLRVIWLTKRMHPGGAGGLPFSPIANKLQSQARAQDARPAWLPSLSVPQAFLPFLQPSFSCHFFFFALSSQSPSLWNGTLFDSESCERG